MAFKKMEADRTAGLRAEAEAEEAEARRRARHMASGTDVLTGRAELDWAGHDADGGQFAHLAITDDAGMVHQVVLRLQDWQADKADAVLDDDRLYQGRLRLRLRGTPGVGVGRAGFAAVDADVL